MDSDTWTTLFLLAVHSTSVSLLFRYARAINRLSFDGPLLVCIVEATKLILATFMALSEHPVKPRLATFTKLVLGRLKDRKNLFSLVFPSLAYALHNNLALIAQERLSVVEYQIGLQARILWMALASRYLMNRFLSRTQVWTLVFLAVGIALVQIGDYMHDSSASGGLRAREVISLWDQVIGWVALFVGTCASGCSGVFLEWLGMQQNENTISRKQIFFSTAAHANLGSGHTGELFDASLFNRIANVLTAGLHGTTL